MEEGSDWEDVVVSVDLEFLPDLSAAKSIEILNPLGLDPNMPILVKVNNTVYGGRLEEPVASLVATQGNGGWFICSQKRRH